MKFLPGMILLAGIALAACSGEQPDAPASQSDAPALAAAPEAASADAGARASDDPITALCEATSTRYTREQCECGTQAFRASNENAGTYADMASYYLNETDPALSLVERWDEVVDVVLADEPGSKLQLSNALGKAHRDAIKACES